MKKVVALLGSKRKMNTYKVLLQIKELLIAQHIDMEIVLLYQYEIKECLGCDRCVMTGKCVIKDQVGILMEKIAAADGVIIASPVYLQQVSGRLKTFIDRTCQWYHRPVLASKPVLAVATTKGSGLKDTLGYIQNVGTQWGGILAGKIGRTIFRIDQPVTEKEVAKFMALLENPMAYAPTLNQLIGFEVQKSLAQYLNGLDAVYWQEQQWFDKAYFYPCSVSRVKHGISGTIGYFMRKGMAKGK